jgi:two-component system CheB/CheR fusion protein
VKKVSADTGLKYQRKAPAKNFPVVGIGASAGGLEAVSEFLQHLHPDLGMAYVFIQHLSPDYDGNLMEILRRKTVMPVVKVTDGVEVARNHIYVIPPNTFIALEESTALKVTVRSKLDVPYHPMDYFLMSLAVVRQHEALAVLLSGTATDGTLGLQAIKEAGGITFTHDETAKHVQMPQHAQEAGYVDFVLSPKKIAKELASLTRHPYVVTPPNEELVKNEEEIKKILNLILRRRGVDFFSHYKRTTIYRRIVRRMALHKIISLSEYAKKLALETAEVEALYHDFLINVTSFFREPDFYKALGKTVFPRIIKKLKPAEPIRIWIAGCATGEEAYSTAICLTELLEKKKLTNPVYIFGTDLNGKAIEKARIGIYPKSLVQHISPQRLRKFFIKIDGHFQIEKSIREMCIFSQHNLLKDPPFSRIDLVSCQNVLIYLEASPQRKILQAFHYALKTTGFLLMSKSESIGNATDLFQPVDKDSRLFLKEAVAVQRLDLGRHTPGVSPPALLETATARTENDVEKESDKLLLARYVPATVLVNKHLEIIRFRGLTSAFLQPASGKASLNLLKMVKDELLFDLKAALQQAGKTGMVAKQENISFDPSRKGLGVTIEVTPMQCRKELYYLIVFRELPHESALAEKGKPGKPEEQKAKTQKLEQALVHGPEQLRATTEEYEATREELQSANEEILSSNEELLSINEQLKTSKEELQSSNEELLTINEELQNRNLELKHSRDYAEAIIETMRGPLVVLNIELRVRTANRAFYQFFRLTQEETEGKFLYELGGGKWNIHALRDELYDILPQQADFKDFLINHDFPGIGERTMIINAHRLIQDEEAKESLILLSFEDITRYKKAEQSLLETQEQLKLALGGGSVGTWSWSVRTNEIVVSREEEVLYRLPPGTLMKTYEEWEKTIHRDDLEATRKALKEAIENKTPLDIEFRILWPDRSIHWILARANTYYGANREPEKMVGVHIDITERRRAVEALQESEKRFHTMSDHAPVMIWMAGPDKQINFVNKTWLSFTGRTMEQESGEGWQEGIHREDMPLYEEVYQDAFEARKEFKVDYRLRRYDGEYRWIMNHGIPRFSGDDFFIGFIGTCVDITDRIDLERQKDDFMGIASHELKTPVTSIKAYTQILQEKFRKANDIVSTNMLTRLDLQIDKLTGLINMLLDVAKMQSGQMDYIEENFDVIEFVQEITEELQRICPDHTIVRQLNTNGQVYGDKSRLGQVLTNLISNAVKYSPKSREIIVKVNRNEDHYIFSVQDFGVGIEKDMQEKIFGRFFRVSEAAGNRVSGLGLGLYISAQIVRQQGGKLWLESEAGKGAIFYFSLPVKKEN